MKRSTRKLALNRETLRSLEGERATEVAGGITLSCNTLCTLCHTNLCVSQNTVCQSGCLPCGTQTDCIGTANC
jgi:hypothetical protein